MKNQFRGVKYHAQDTKQIAKLTSESKSVLTEKNLRSLGSTRDAIRIEVVILDRRIKISPNLKLGEGEPSLTDSGVKNIGQLREIKLGDEEARIQMAKKCGLILQLNNTELEILSRKVEDETRALGR